MSRESMLYRRLGQAGIRVSAISLGGWTTFGSSVKEQETVAAILKAAYEAGVTFFDIADVYARGEAERVMGAVLKQFPRHELVISSKVFWPMSDDVNDRGLSRKHIVESIDKTLLRIGTDYLDAYFCHRYDEDTPLDETVRAMDDLVRAGKILYWGTSEWSGAQLKNAHAIADRRNQAAPSVEQPQYSLLARKRVDDEVGKAARETGMGLVVWSPLASGVLTGKYDDGIPSGSRLDRIDWLRTTFLTDENRARVKRFGALAQEMGVSRTKLALAWSLSRPGISSVITGATSLAQLEENLGALQVKITDEVAKKLDEIFPS
jgi:voltage-dependent potassium channel beta subunit